MTSVVLALAVASDSAIANNRIAIFNEFICCLFLPFPLMFGTSVRKGKGHAGRTVLTLIMICVSARQCARIGRRLSKQFVGEQRRWSRSGRALAASTEEAVTGHTYISSYRYSRNFSPSPFL